jgi:hypothetical protein
MKRHMTCTWHAGHVVAESKGGGPTNVQNLRPVCISCNMSMGSKNMMEFKAQIRGWHFL